MGLIHPTKKGTPENYSILLGFLFILSIIATSFQFFNYPEALAKNISPFIAILTVFLLIIKTYVKRQSADGSKRHHRHPFNYSAFFLAKRSYTSADLRSKTIALSSLLRIPFARYFTPFSQDGIVARIRSTITAFW